MIAMLGKVPLVNGADVHAPQWDAIVDAAAAVASRLAHAYIALACRERIEAKCRRGRPPFLAGLFFTQTPLELVVFE